MTANQGEIPVFLLNLTISIIIASSAMATVNFQNLVCNNSLGAVTLHFQVPPNPIYSAGSMTPGVHVNIGVSRSFTGTKQVTLSVNTSGGTINRAHNIPATPTPLSLTFSFPGATYTLACNVS